MAVKFPKLFDYIKQSSLSKMNAEKRAGLAFLIADGGASDEQKRMDPAAPILDLNAAMSDDDWEELYFMFQEILRAMAGDSSLRGNEDALKFLNAYLDNGLSPIFESFKNDVGPLVGVAGLLNARFLPIMNSYEEQIKNSLGLTTPQFVALQADFAGATAPFADKKLEEKLKQVLQIVSSDAQQRQGRISELTEEIADLTIDLAAAAPADRAKIQAEIDKATRRQTRSNWNTAMVVGGVSRPQEHLALIADINRVLTTDITQEPTRVAAKITRFRAAHKEILGDIMGKDKLRDTFLSKADNELYGTISGAMKASDFSTIPEKYEDGRKWLQRKKDDVKEVVKYRFGSTKQLPPLSRNIAKAIEAAEITPEKGLADLVKNADKIKENLYPAAVKPFEFMIKKLKALSKTPQFQDALKSGKAAETLMKDINRGASEDKKIAETMVIQDIVYAMSYTTTSSAIRGDIKKIDGNMIKGTTLDKATNGVAGKVFKFGMETAIRGTFELVNAAKNAIRLRTGTDNVQKMITAEEAIKRDARSTTPHDLTYFKTQATDAQTAYVLAVSRGENAKKAKENWDKAELMAKTKEKLVAIAGRGAPVALKDKTALEIEQYLTMRWHFLKQGNTKGIQVIDNILSSEKDFYAEKDENGNPITSKYQEKLNQYEINWFKSRGLSA